MRLYQKMNQKTKYLKKIAKTVDKNLQHLLQL